MANSIRINKGVQKIEVNDDGDYILLPLGDDTFIQSFYKMLDDVKKKAETAAGESSSKEESPESILGEMEKVVGVGDFLFDKTEHLFGEGTCRKVFGEIRPGVSMFMEFFDAIIPFIEEYQRERDSRLNKYGAGRMGSV